MTFAERYWREANREWIAATEKDIRARLEKEFAAREFAAWRKVLLSILTDRFGPPPGLLVIFIEASEDLDLLSKLTRQAVTAASLDAFHL